MSIIWLHKPIGWTPKSCIDEYKRITNRGGKIAFAGRLDPMASGLLPIVVNGTRETASELESCYKTYQFKVILGLQTDTYDILGLLANIQEDRSYTEIDIENIIDTASTITVQEYPPFSSKTVLDERTGKKVSLWKLALEGTPVSLPQHNVDIKYIKLLNHTTISSEDVLSIINDRIKQLLPSIDMRRFMILSRWKEILPVMTNRRFQLIECEAKVSSGTYIRSIANSIGGVCLDINRIQYGTKILTNSIDKFQFAIL